MEDFKLRLFNEQAQLCEKIDKLEAFINKQNDDNQTLSDEYIALLIRQLHYMKKYSEILHCRLEYE